MPADRAVLDAAIGDRRADGGRSARLRFRRAEQSMVSELALAWRHRAVGHTAEKADMGDLDTPKASQPDKQRGSHALRIAPMTFRSELLGSRPPTPAYYKEAPDDR